MELVNPNDVSAAEIAAALNQIYERITPRQLAALRTLFAAKGHVLPDDGDGRLSEPVLMFGKIGGQLSRQLGKKPEKGYHLLWVAYKELGKKDLTWYWRMRKNFAEALTLTGWFHDAPTNDDEFYREVTRSLKDDPKKRRARLKAAPKLPERVVVTSITFKRNPDVVAEVLLRASGECESCHLPAPFSRTSDGTPYLEVHHRVPLAQGGNDTVNNAIALCPNCHRKAHYG